MVRAATKRSQALSILLHLSQRSLESIIVRLLNKELLCTINLLCS